jgi:hypothetical protein
MCDSIYLHTYVGTYVKLLCIIGRPPNPKLPFVHMYVPTYVCLRQEAHTQGSNCVVRGRSIKRLQNCQNFKIEMARCRSCVFLEKNLSQNRGTSLTLKSILWTKHKLILQCLIRNY